MTIVTHVDLFWVVDGGMAYPFRTLEKAWRALDLFTENPDFWKTIFSGRFTDTIEGFPNE